MSILYRLCIIMIFISILVLFFAHLFISYPKVNHSHSYNLDNLSLVVKNSYYIEI